MTNLSVDYSNKETMLLCNLTLCPNIGNADANGYLSPGITDLQYLVWTNKLLIAVKHVPLCRVRTQHKIAVIHCLLKLTISKKTAKKKKKQLDRKHLPS